MISACVVASPIPCIQTADNRCVARQVISARGQNVDDLAAANLTLGEP